MASVTYNVELIQDDTDGLAWIAACAMVKTYGAKTDASVADLFGSLANPDAGFDDLGGNWNECVQAIGDWNFKVQGVGDVAAGEMDTAAVVKLLQGSGPFVLLHRCIGFPYGDGYDDGDFTAEDAHAVAVIGADLEAGTATFANPWDDAPRTCALQALATKINADSGQGKTIAVWPGAVPLSSDDASSSSSEDGSSSSSSESSSDSDESSSAAQDSASDGSSNGDSSSDEGSSSSDTSAADSSRSDDSASDDSKSSSDSSSEESSSADESSSSDDGSSSDDSGG